MTRAELARLREAREEIERNPHRALCELDELIADAKFEHQREDAWHDRPINLEEPNGSH